MDRISQRLNTLFAQEKWSEARRVIEARLESSPDDHWLLERLATTNYEERQYAKALSIIEQARKLVPECPLAIWTHANTLDMLGRIKDASALYARLIKRAADSGFESIAVDECGEGQRWTLELMTDCVYRLALCCAKMNKKKPGGTDLALRMLRKIAHWRDMGVEGIYDAADVQKQIERLEGPPAVIPSPPNARASGARRVGRRPGRGNAQARRQAVKRGLREVERDLRMAM